MTSTILSEEKNALAQNLIETCGLHRALHAARQFGWHDIANEISKKIDGSAAAAKMH